MRSLTVGVHSKFSTYSQKPIIRGGGENPYYVKNTFDYPKNKMCQSALDNFETLKVMIIIVVGGWGWGDRLGIP